MNWSPDCDSLAIEIEPVKRILGESTSVSILYNFIFQYELVGKSIKGEVTQDSAAAHPAASTSQPQWKLLITVKTKKEKLNFPSKYFAVFRVRPWRVLDEHRPPVDKSVRGSRAMNRNAKKNPSEVS